MAAARMIQGPYQFVSEHVQSEPFQQPGWCRASEPAPSASKEAASVRPQLRPRAAALVQRLQAEQTRPASLQALEGSKWGGPCAERGPHQRRESRPEPPLAAVQQSGAPSTGSRHADDEPRGRAGRPAAPQQPEDDAWCPPLARIPALQQLLSSSGVAASAAEQAASRSRHSFPGSRGQHDDGGALTPTSRGAPLSRLRHGSGAGRLHLGQDLAHPIDHLALCTSRRLLLLPLAAPAEC